jgi:hypothetical protein
METRIGKVVVGWPRLPQVVQELVSLVVGDDWERSSTEGDEHFYYIVGRRSHEAHQIGEQRFDTHSIPRPLEVSPVRQAEVHAQVASARPIEYYVGRARKRLEATGFDRTLIDTFVAGMEGAHVDWAPLSGKFAFAAGSEEAKAFGDLLIALAMKAGIEPEPTSEVDRRYEADVAVQKLYLRELANLYESVVKRAGAFDVLPFSDPLLQEASRSYLYGFFRATVLLSASAIERALGEAIGAKGGVVMRNRSTGAFYEPLVSEATARGLLGAPATLGQPPMLANHSTELFTLRNNVAHKGHVPDVTEAADAIAKARQVVEFLRR